MENQLGICPPVRTDKLSPSFIKNSMSRFPWGHYYLQYLHRVIQYSIPPNLGSLLIFPRRAMWDGAYVLLGVNSLSPFSLNFSQPNKTPLA